MREIKFRAWDETAEAFIYSDQIAGGMWRYFKTLEDRGIRHFMSQQFTGLKDKNGKEIYEGDILTTDEYPFYKRLKSYHKLGSSGYVVSFKDSGFYPFNEYCANPEINGYMSAQFCEVIGNIYENPELLP